MSSKPKERPYDPRVPAEYQDAKPPAEQQPEQPQQPAPQQPKPAAPTPPPPTPAEAPKPATEPQKAA